MQRGWLEEGIALRGGLGDGALSRPRRSWSDAVLTYVRGCIKIVIASMIVGVAPMQSSSAQANRPQATQIIPDSAPAGAAYPVRATIVGDGFLQTNNVVDFGPVKIAGLASPDGTHITFNVPKVRPTGGEAPPAVLTPGRYQVTVTVGSQVSNSVTFTLTAGPP